VDALRHSVHGYETNVAARFPPTDPELRSLMRDCGVGDGDPMMFLGVVAAPPAEIEGRLVTRPSLIPAIPVVLLDALPESRRRTYLDRFMERSAFAGGWILRSDRSTDLRLAFPGQTLAMVQKRTAVLLGEIGRFYRPVSERHSAHWQLIRVVRRGPER